MNLTNDGTIGLVVTVSEPKRADESYSVRRAGEFATVVKLDGKGGAYMTNLDGRCSCPWGQHRQAVPSVKVCRHVAMVCKLVDMKKI
jgi:hypothetical protein